MKKILFIPLFFLLILSQIAILTPRAHADPIVITPFADANFEACVRTAMGIPEDPITDVQALTLTTLECSSQEITDTTDLEHFTNLTYLSLSANDLTSIDLSANTALTSLYLYADALTTIDVSANTALSYLDLASNALTTIDVSANTALNYLDLYGNALTTIDLSANTALNYLDLYGNALTTIDVSANTALTHLDLNSNDLTSIDVSANTALSYLDLASNALTTIDVSANTDLTTLDLASNALTTIDVSANTDLSSLQLYDNDLTTIDVSANTALTYLGLNSNNLTSINVSANTALVILRIGVNALTSIDVSANTALTYLDLYVNALTTIDLSANTALSSLYLSHNALTSIDLSANTALTELLLSGNDLTSIDLSANTALNYLDLYGNALTSIDLSANTALTWLDLASNALTSIDLSANTALTDLRLDENDLTSIVLPASTALDTLHLSSNDLTTIDVSANTALTTLDLSNNNITDISSLVANAGLGAGDTVYLTSNPLNLASFDDMNTLIARGVLVTYSWLCGNSSVEGSETCDDGNNENGDECSSVCQIETPVEITFTDANFETCVRDALEIPTDPITNEDALTLTELICSSDSITNLTGLEYFTNLTSLNLGDNEIIDISALEELTNLNQLWLHDNQITDISALEGLTSLGSLMLYNNQIIDISVLEGLTGLIGLTFYGNQIVDISALEGLINLTTLYLNDNEIIDISVLEELTNLTLLWLNENQIIDISALEGLTNLTTLNLFDNQIIDISALDGLTSLTNLNLTENQIIDISALEGLINLIDLTLYDNQIIDISALEGLTNLNTLTLDNNEVTDISALSGLTNLTWLNLYENQIIDISVLEGLTNLTNLWLDVNHITNIQPLVDNEGINSGDEVNLSNNPLSDESVALITVLTDRGVNVTYEEGGEGLTMTDAWVLDEDGSTTVYTLFDVPPIGHLPESGLETYFSIEGREGTASTAALQSEPIEYNETTYTDQIIIVTFDDPVTPGLYIVAEGYTPVEVVYYDDGELVCTDFTYSAWGSCSGGTRTRTVLTSSPEGCSGGSPVLSQSCSGGGAIIFHYKTPGPSEPDDENKNNEEENKDGENKNNEGTENIAKQIIETADQVQTQVKIDKVTEKAASGENLTKEEKTIEKVKSKMEEFLSLRVKTESQTQKSYKQTIESAKEIFAGSADADGDGISNAQELKNGTDPFINNRGTIKDVFAKAPKEGGGDSSIGRLKVAVVSSNGFILTGTVKPNTEVTVKAGGNTFKTTSDKNGHYLVPVELANAAINSLVAIETDVDGKSSKILAKVEKDTLPTPTFELKGKNISQIKDFTAADLIDYVTSLNPEWVREIVISTLDSLVGTEYKNTIIARFEIRTGKGEKIIVQGHATPGSTVILAYKSVIYSSVVIADKNGDFTSELPKDLSAELNKNKDLKEIQHELISFAVDYKTNKVSSFTKGLFKLFQ